MADGEVVYDLLTLLIDAQVLVNGIIEECADSSGANSKRFGRQVETVADGSGFEVNVAISAVTVRTGGSIKVRNHREGDAGIAGEVLSQTQPGGRDTLVALQDQFEFPAVRPVPVNAGFQTFVMFPESFGYRRVPVPGVSEDLVQLLVRSR